jgi:predicted dehydrogenase
MKVTVVGLGSIGLRHLRNLICLNQKRTLDHKIEKITLVDADAERRKQAELEFGLETKTSLTSALTKKQDVVFVCTPSNSHVAVAKEAASAGCHLFIEKPLSNQLDGVSELGEIIRKSGKVCLIACNMWFHPGIKKFGEILKSGELGTPRLFHSYWGHHFEQWQPGSNMQNHYCLDENKGGGALFDVGSHELFFIPKILGKITNASLDCGPSGFVEAKVDDFSHIMVGLENGVRGTFCFNFLDRCRRRSLEVIGSDATAIWRSEGKDPARESLQVFAGNIIKKDIPIESLGQDMFQKTLIHFFRCLAGKEQPRQSFEDAEQVLKIIMALKNTKRYQKD